MMTLEFNAPRDRLYAFEEPRFETVLHIFDANWHGIRSATAAVPGHKLAINHKETSEPHGLKHILGLIFHHQITRVVFQGFSPLADQIARHLKATLAGDISLFVVGHVNSAQLEYYFEMDMQALIARGVQESIFERVGSVKPLFHTVFPGCFEKTIINPLPKSPFEGGAQPATEAGTLFLPLETGWRKNLWTNMIAALNDQTAQKIYTVNWPKGLEALHDLSRVSATGFLDRRAMFSQIARAEVLMNVTLAECQPMTQLEALAVGTPALMGRLDIPELKDEWSALTEVSPVDSPAPLIKALNRLKTLMKTDPSAVTDMMQDHIKRRQSLALSTLAEFLYV